MKKFALINLLIVLALAACGTATSPTAAPASTSATDTPVVSTAAPASVTDTPAGSPATESATPEVSTETVSTAPSDTPDTASSSGTSASSTTTSDCTDSAAFVADVTVPDNQAFPPGENFVKTWRIKNTGTCTWTDRYHLVFSKGDQMKAPDSSALKQTPPGNMLDISVNMTSPSDASTTSARADFEIRDPAGKSVQIDGGPVIWVIITVNNVTAQNNTIGSGSNGGSSSGSNTGSNSGSSSSSNTGSATSTPIPAKAGYAIVTCAYSLDQGKIEEVLAALNAYRARWGVPAYNVKPQLNESAQSQANDMACNQLFYHYGSNGSTPKTRVATSGYVASYVTENVYGSYPPLSGSEAIDWWAADTIDPRHNENLLSTKYKDIGIGYAFFDNFGYYVIDFAVPK